MFATHPARVPVRDIGTSGFSLESELEFSVGEVREFRLQFGHESPLPLRARVVHSLRVNSAAGAYFLTGFEFSDLDRDTECQLLRILDRSLQFIPPDQTAV